jgi:hypothetical protein
MRSLPKHARAAISGAEELVALAYTRRQQPGDARFIDRVQRRIAAV